LRAGTVGTTKPVLVAPHQPEQLLDVARADIDHHVVDALQELLQLGELPPSDRDGLTIVRVDALDRDDLTAGNARGEQVTGHRRLAYVAREVDDG